VRQPKGLGVHVHRLLKRGVQRRRHERRHQCTGQRHTHGEPGRSVAVRGVCRIRGASPNPSAFCPPLRGLWQLAASVLRTDTGPWALLAHRSPGSPVWCVIGSERWKERLAEHSHRRGHLHV
jgi:hypothetical protein